MQMFGAEPRMMSLGGLLRPRPSPLAGGGGAPGVARPVGGPVFPASPGLPAPGASTGAPMQPTAPTAGMQVAPTTPPPMVGGQMYPTPQPGGPGGATYPANPIQTPAPLQMRPAQGIPGAPPSMMSLADLLRNMMQRPRGIAY